MFLVIVGVSGIAYVLIGYYTAFWRSRFYLPLAFLLGFCSFFAPGNPLLQDSFAVQVGGGIVLGILSLRANKVLVESLYKKLP